MATFGKYQFIKKLATGGMAEVWLARQTGIEGFNRHIVIKRILPHLAEDKEFVQMFLNEARVASRLTHANIAQIYELGQIDGQYYIAMEFVHGEDLGRLMRKAWSTGQWIARPLAIRIVASACEGLHYAHTRVDENGRALKVVHRDISPQNILVSFDGSVKVVDFGIAKAADQESMTKSGAIKGKFAYMAPEQAAGKPLDARTDIFAIGLVLYELLTGVRPLKRESELATLQAALECAIDPPSVVAEVPSELDDVVMRALAKAPDDRYKDARQFQSALEEFLIGQRMVATSVQVSELMETLFADRRAEEARLGAPNPSSQESMSGMPGVGEPPSWDAKEGTEPPPEEPRPPPRRERERERRPPPPPQPPPRAAKASDDDAAGYTDPLGTNTGDAAEWDAPPALPSRKYAQTASRPALARDEPESTRARPTGLRADVIADARGTRARKSSSAAVPIMVDDSELRGEVPPERDPPLATNARRSSSSLLKKKSSTEMPAAPPRRNSRVNLEALDEPPKKKKKASEFYDAADGEPSVDVTGIRMRQKKSLRTVMVVCLVLAVAGLGFFFKDMIPDLKKLFTGVVGDGPVPVLLTISSNPKTRIIVVKPSGEKIDLGEVPIDRARGANVGDTVVMQSADLGIYFEDKVIFGQHNENRVLFKDFVTGKLKVTVTPAAKGLTVWRGTQRVAENLQVTMELYEGTQKLEIRGDALRQPVAFEVVIKPKEITTAKVDISGAVNK